MFFIVIAVAEHDGKINPKSLATSSIKNLRTFYGKHTLISSSKISHVHFFPVEDVQGAAENKPKSPPAAVNVTMRKKSFVGVLKRLS